MHTHAGTLYVHTSICVELVQPVLGVHVHSYLGHFRCASSSNADSGIHGADQLSLGATSNLLPCQCVTELQVVVHYITGDASNKGPVMRVKDVR